MRKILVYCFALLCLLFAIIALHVNFKFSSPDENKSIIKTDNHRDWGEKLLKDARKNNKLIFFCKEGRKPINLTKEAQNALNDNYLCVNINFDAWPADFIILDDILFAKTGKRGSLEAGILGTKMYPIYLTSKVREKDTQYTPSISTFITATANEFKVNPKKVFTELRSLIEEKYINDTLKYSKMEAPFIPQFGFIPLESLRLHNYFNDPRNFNAPIAEISENLRLAIRIAATDLQQTYARAAAEKGAHLLLMRLSQSHKELKEDLVILRALTEIGILGNYPKIKMIVKEHCDKILNSQNSNGIFIEENSIAYVRYNATCVLIMTKAYTLFKDKKYLVAAQNCLEKLLALRKPYGEMPAIANSSKPSMASSIEYTHLLVACCNMHYITRDVKYLEHIKEIFDEWNEFYLLPSGLWSINSEHSVLATYTRPILIYDSYTPSYHGEAAQVIFYLDKNNIELEIPNANRIRRLAAANLITSPILNLPNASFKLAYFSFKDIDSPAGIKNINFYKSYIHKNTYESFDVLEEMRLKNLRQIKPNKSLFPSKIN